MTPTDQISVNLPTDVIRLVREKVASGAYASESELVEEAIRTLSAQENGIESWLLDEVVPVYDAMESDPSRALTGEQVREELRSVADRLRNSR